LKLKRTIMFKSKKIAVVIPTHNVEKQIGKVITTLPKYIDKIIVIDDRSTDSTSRVIKKLKKKNKKILLFTHNKNQGVGGAIATGFVWCRDHKIDIAVVMDGDGQMLPEDLPEIITPVALGECDFSKANRLISGTAFKKIPKNRYFGNSILTFLTKIASGYWHVMDSQAGYRAINKKMLNLIDWDKMYKRYGQPNDLLVRLNVYNARVRDVPLEPVYGIGEKSGIKIRKVFFTIPCLLLKMFLWRMKEKYIIRDFHPLVFFYFFGFLLGLASLILFIRELLYWPRILQFNFLTMMFCGIASIQFIIFAMWFDMEYNKDLK
jgi:glycosyltransferase involved in cell wall biosynthesis